MIWRHRPDPKYFFMAFMHIQYILGIYILNPIELILLPFLSHDITLELRKKGIERDIEREREIDKEREREKGTKRE